MKTIARTLAAVAVTLSAAEGRADDPRVVLYLDARKELRDNATDILNDFGRTSGVALQAAYFGDDNTLLLSPAAEPSGAPCPEDICGEQSRWREVTPAPSGGFAQQSTLTDVLKRGTRASVLVISAHGLGHKGGAVPPKKNVPTVESYKSVGSAGDALLNKHLAEAVCQGGGADLVVLDACGMSAIEVLVELTNTTPDNKPCATYVLANEDSFSLNTTALDYTAAANATVVSATGWSALRFGESLVATVKSPKDQDRWILWRTDRLTNVSALLESAAAKFLDIKDATIKSDTLKALQACFYFGSQEDAQYSADAACIANAITNNASLVMETKDLAALSERLATNVGSSTSAAIKSSKWKASDACRINSGGASLFLPLRHGTPQDVSLYRDKSVTTVVGASSWGSVAELALTAATDPYPKPFYCAIANP